MERLTKSENGVAWFKEPDMIFEPCEMSYTQVGTALRRLAAYEDTGLTPEQILAMKQELVDERHRHDRLMDFEVAEAQELAKVKAERAALLVTLKHYAPCEDCENWDMENEICVCSSDCKCGEKWSWRGHIAPVSEEAEANQCPMRGDYCPVPDDPGVCRFEEGDDVYESK